MDAKYKALDITYQVFHYKYYSGRYLFTNIVFVIKCTQSFKKVIVFLLGNSSLVGTFMGGFSGVDWWLATPF